MDRDIEHHGHCGHDGNMYKINWDGKIESSEATVRERSFTNMVKVSHSAFNFPIVSKEEALKQGLYSYPSFYDDYKQPSILGIDRFIVPQESKRLKIKFEYLNGRYGKTNKVKVFTLLFKNKPISIVHYQEAYWDGGNQNELVVCMSLDDQNNIQWVKPFSWCDNKRIVVDIREDVMSLKKFDGDKIYDIYVKDIQRFFHYKDFKDFNYLTFEPTSGQILFVFIGTFIITIAILWWAIVNEETEDSEERKRKYRW